MTARRSWSMVPPGATPPARAPRVAVIGAGMAGLVAARLLHDSGCTVAVFEARDRLGGRVWTDSSLGTPIDLGGSWIHGADDNPLTDWCHALGIPVIETTGERSYYVDGARPTTLDALQRRAWRGRTVLRLALAWGALRHRVAHWLGQKPHISLADVADPVLRAGWLPEFDRRLLALTVSTSEGVQGAPADRLAIEEWFPADAFKVNAMPQGGFGRLIDDVAEGLDVRLEHPVDRIDWAHEKVWVHTVQSTPHAFDAAVVAVPLGILQSGRLGFQPALPPDKAAAIARLGYGGDAVLGKLYLRFPYRFWPADQNRFGTLPRTPMLRGRFASWFSLERETGAPILLGFCNGRFGAKLAHHPSDRDVVALGVKSLGAIFGNDVPPPVAARFTRWLTDPWALGSYSYPAVGSLPEDRRIYGQPIGDRLLFAGEATEDGIYGTVHAALLSGERAAETVFARVIGSAPDRSRRPWGSH